MTTLQQEYDTAVSAVRVCSITNYLRLIDDAAACRRILHPVEYADVVESTCVYLCRDTAAIVADYSVGSVAFSRACRGCKVPAGSNIASYVMVANVGGIRLGYDESAGRFTIELALLIMYIRRGLIPNPFCSKHYWFKCPLGCGPSNISKTAFDKRVNAHVAELLDDMVESRELD